MAQGIQLEREAFCCSICLDLLNDPVTLACGHSYCKDCINNHLDSKDDSGIYSCPQCRQIFLLRPVLVKNSMLTVVVEELKKTGPHTDAPIEDCHAGPEDVACDICSEKKLKAIKSCLHCLASYCEKHLQPHSDVPALRKHKLVKAAVELQESVCSRHQEAMRLFCLTDQCCICYLCSKEEHKDHNTVSAAAERTERQRELEAARQQIQLRIQEKEEDVRAFQQEEDTFNNSADEALGNTEKIFTELIIAFEKKLSEIREKIQSQQKTEAGWLKKIRDKVEQEITELRRKDDELEKLLHTEDHTHFLLNYPSLFNITESKDQPSVKLHRLRYFEKFAVALSEAREKLQEVLRDECTKILMTVTEANHSATIHEKPETRADIPQTRTDYFQTTANFVKTRILKNRWNFLQDSNNTLETVANLIQRQDDPPQTETHRNQTRTNPLQTPSDLMQSTTGVAKTKQDFVQSGDDPVQTRPDVLLARAHTLKSRADILKTRANFLQHACLITLDPDTANPHLLLSKENRKVVFTGEEQKYPVHPGRFAYSWQVLSRESLTGRCYLEVERSGKGVLVAVTYKDISRTGTFTECTFGLNNKSWALDCFKNSYEFRHNNIKTSIPGMWSSKLGVYLDHRAGILSFYSVSETRTLLHRVQTTFTQPLYAGLWLSDGAAAEVSKLT
ncbi:tripartite motif-containing protein 16-like [Melanotaenia boesemani]|uniref:tripartite motif-containing protein 16-like n=1 Tax=Melanotaenia boesemani TaxID=1250792 RepID=UPI001C046A2E|nr:tripartite motif-containing protein 16-like [Melanotaenia boesemani]